MQLIDQIFKNASQPPIVIFMGDHGFRHFFEPVDTAYYFNNLNTVYLPGQNYAAFKDSMSAVNGFRAVLNSAYGQSMSILKDSTIWIDEK